MNACTTYVICHFKPCLQQSFKSRVVQNSISPFSFKNLNIPKM